MIKFPSMHIAESALNRIQNTLEDVAPLFPSLQPAPIVPGASTPALGQQIEEELEPSAEPVEVPEDPMAAAAAGETISGGSPLAGMLRGVFG